MRHFITLNDISAAEYQRILELAAALKKDLKAGRTGEGTYCTATHPAVQAERFLPLTGKMMGMIFEKSSLRTRVSFETGMFQLGGSAMFLGGEIGFGKRESVKDIAEVLSSMVDVIMIRAIRHQNVEDLARYSRCPVINGLTDLCHPCQALADMMTIYEVFGQVQGIKLAYIGDANNVAASLLRSAAKLGLKFAAAAPKGFQFAPERVKELVGDSPASGFELTLTTDPAAAVKDAHAVYTDVWVSMGQESEEESRKKVFAPYQVNADLMRLARKEAVFLHCLPARRGLEVTDEVMDSPQSRAVQQAENRLHAQKGLLVWLLHDMTAPKPWRY